MVSITLVDRLGRFTDKTFERSRLDNAPANLENAASEYGRPHAHTILYTKYGYVLVQKRTELKKTGPGLILPFHGGHVTEPDKIEAEKRGKIQDAYRIGAVRELGLPPEGELGIKVQEGELRFVVKKYLKSSGLGYYAFMKFFDLIYDRDRHGTLKKFYEKEVSDVFPLTVEDIEKKRLFNVLGENLGKYLLLHAKQTSFKIRRFSPEYVLKEMRGEVPVLEVPEDLLNLTTLEISPEDLMRELKLKKNANERISHEPVKRRRPKFISRAISDLKDYLNR